MTRRHRTHAAGALVVLALGACSSGVRPDAGPVALPSAVAAFHGVEPDVAAGQSGPTRPSFVLRDTAGNRYDFAAQTRGRPTLLYFGYTSCPDECPTALADIAGALRATPSALRDQVRVVFVTTDPARDTGPVVRRFLDQWSDGFVGLVGTQSEVDAAQVATGITAAARGGDVETVAGKPDEHVHKQGTAPHQHFGPLGYGVGHANVIFGFDVADRLPVLYPGGVRPSDIAADLPLLAAAPSGDTP